MLRFRSLDSDASASSRAIVSEKREVEEGTGQGPHLSSGLWVRPGGPEVHPGAEATTCQQECPEQGAPVRQPIEGREDESGAEDGPDQR